MRLSACSREVAASVERLQLRADARGQRATPLIERAGQFGRLMDGAAGNRAQRLDLVGNLLGCAAGLCCDLGQQALDLLDAARKPVLDGAEIAAGAGRDLLQQDAGILQASKHFRQFAAQPLVGADERFDGACRALVDRDAHRFRGLHVGRSDLRAAFLEGRQHRFAAFFQRAERDVGDGCYIAADRVAALAEARDERQPLDIEDAADLADAAAKRSENRLSLLVHGLDNAVEAIDHAFLEHRHTLIERAGDFVSAASQRFVDQGGTLIESAGDFVSAASERFVDPGGTFDRECWRCRQRGFQRFVDLGGTCHRGSH